MGYRRKARELAMQALYYMDMRHNCSNHMLDNYCHSFMSEDRNIPFFGELVRGVMARRNEIDQVIERFSNNWKINRMPCVDRNIIRIAVYELLNCNDIPPKVSINEAIDIGKKYGTKDSGAFINGILDSVHLALENNEIQIHQNVIFESEETLEG
ncbi:MAG: transcription antitermination factor NusB [Desulfobacterales bacterium]|nr:transcription antitermination factor NusB [Desulfobacterales bacterium]